MKRILFVCDLNTTGGLGKIISWVANKMKESGFCVEMCFIYQANSESNAKISVPETHLNFPLYRSAIKRYLLLFTIIPFRLYKLIKRGQYDCVVSFSQSSFNLLVFLKYLVDFTLVVSERGDPYTAAAIGDKIRRFFYRFADIIVFQTVGAKNYFGKIVKRKSQLIPNPVKLPCFQWDIKGAKKSIVCPARFHIFQKRQDILLRAFSLVHRKHPEYVLELCGKGADKYEIERMVFDLNLSDCVLLSHTLDIYGTIVKSRVFVLSSDYEGLPNALMEAMALGMPVVSTDCSPGGAAMLINNEENGLLVPKADYNALATAIEKVIEDDDLSIRISQNARKTMLEYDEDKIAAKWATVFTNEVR